MRKRFAALFVTILLLGASQISAGAQEQGFKYFSETGHNVRGQFLVFYSQNPNATLLYGYPITEEFINQDAIRIQYFQRARFELHPELPQGQRVILTRLGTATYTSSGRLDVPGKGLACRKFPETGVSVCFDFLGFFDSYGGLGQFGYPISEFEYHEGRVVQYFEYARLEWQPARPEGQRVVVSDLGRIFFDNSGEDPALLPPIKPLDNTPSAILAIHPSAFFQRAVTLAQDDQIIYIIVQDQNLQPVSGADCVVTIHWPSVPGQTSYITTNNDGVGVIPFSFSNQPHGNLISADVACQFGGLASSTSTSFRIWY